MHMQAAKSYRQTSQRDYIENANPEQIIHFLLTQLKRELNRLKGCIDEKDLVARSDASTRALMTVHLLGTSLDFEKGGAIATNLFQLYEHIRLTVIKAGNENDSNVLRSAIIVAGDIEDAWKSLIELSAK